MNINLSQECIQALSQLQDGMGGSNMIMEVEDFFIENHAGEDEAREILIFIKNLRYLRRLIEKIEKRDEL